MADTRSHQGNIYELVQPLQPVRGGKTNIDYAIAAEQIAASKQSRKESESRINKQGKGGGGEDDVKLPIGSVGGPQRLVGTGGGQSSAPSQLEQIKTEKAQLELNDYKALREASNKSLDEFEKKLGQVDPQTLLDYRQNKENLRKNIINNDAEDFRNKVDRQAALGDLSLFADNMVQNTNNPNIYNSFKPMFKSLDPNAPDKYNRAYLAAGIAQGTPISRLLQQDPENSKVIAGARQQHINGILKGLQSDIGQQFGDLVKLSQLPGSLGQYGQNVMENAISSSIKNTLQKQAANAPAGYRYTDESQNRLEPIEGGPADKITAQDAAKLQFLNTSKTTLPQVQNLIFDDTGKIRRNTVQKASSPITWGKGRELDRTMTIGIESALRAMTGAVAPEGEVKRYKGLFLPNALDSDETITNKFKDYSNFINQTSEGIQGGRSAMMNQTQNTQQISPVLDPKVQQQIKQLKYERDKGLSEGRDVTMMNEWYRQELNKLTGGR